jgi:hypothetical protein
MVLRKVEHGALPPPPPHTHTHTGTLAHYMACPPTRTGTLNVQAGTQFCDSEFQREVNGGQLSSSSLNSYTW